MSAILRRKVAIAEGYHPKRVRPWSQEEDMQLSKEAIGTIIDWYTRESGVRGLDKQIAKIARITAQKIALEGTETGTR